VRLFEIKIIFPLAPQNFKQAVLVSGNGVGASSNGSGPETALRTHFSVSKGK